MYLVRTDTLRLFILHDSCLYLYLQISYASTSPALSKRNKYKTFFRLATADSSHNAARRMFIQHFNWDTVSTIYENKEVYYLVSMV
jgi:hypothetical protein